MPVPPPRWLMYRRADSTFWLRSWIHIRESIGFWLLSRTSITGPTIRSVIGMFCGVLVTPPPVAVTRIVAVYVPGLSPVELTLTVTLRGVVPLGGVSESHATPSTMLAVQLTTPGVPVLPMFNV